jgi:hypothetical protein
MDLVVDWDLAEFAGMPAGQAASRSPRDTVPTSWATKYWSHSSGGERFTIERDALIANGDTVAQDSESGRSCSPVTDPSMASQKLSG